MRNACAEGVELVRGLQELNDLLQLGLFLIGTGHIGKGCLALVLLLILDLGAAHIHDAAPAPPRYIDMNSIPMLPIIAT